MGTKEAKKIQADAAREALDALEAQYPAGQGFWAAQLRLAKRGPQARPYGHRVEAACNEETMDVIDAHAEMGFRGSRSDAIRDLIARGAAAVAAEQA